MGTISSMHSFLYLVFVLLVLHFLLDSGVIRKQSPNPSLSHSLKPHLVWLGFEL